MTKQAADVAPVEIEGEAIDSCDGAPAICSGELLGELAERNRSCRPHWRCLTCAINKRVAGNIAI
jgi:hypothetical protein